MVLILFYQVPKIEAATLLQYHSRGNQVYDVQKNLVRMGYLHTSPTGYFGPATERAVKEFQLDTSLYANGVVGTSTYNRLLDVERMAHVVHGEARGESFTGQVAVASVILNRTKSNVFPKTVSGVIFQTNAFTCVLDNQYNMTPNRTAYRAVIDAFKGWDPSNGSTYYYNPSLVTNKWIFTRSKVIRIGNQVFTK